MEGVGSRQSRAMSRYGSSQAAPVFNGTVRKWKKQWVSSSDKNSKGNNNNNNASTLLLCRWTPLADDTNTEEEPRKRRFRYAPIVPIEKASSEVVDAGSQEAKLSKITQWSGDVDTGNAITDGIFGTPSGGGGGGGNGEFSAEETQEPSEDQSDSNISAGHGFKSRGNRKADDAWRNLQIK